MVAQLATSAAVQPLKVYTGSIPAEGRQCIPFNADFSSATLLNVDFSALASMQRRISMIQTVYVDNSKGTAAVTIVASASNQNVSAPAGAQGYFPLLLTDGMSVLLQCAQPAVIPMFFLNFMVAPAVWSASGVSAYNGSGQLLVSDPALEATVVGGVQQTTIAGNRSWTDASATVTAGGTAQTALTANAGRSAYRFCNLSSANLFVNDNGNPAGPATTGSIEIPAGALYETQPGLCSPAAISVFGATTGQAYTLLWS